MGRLLTVSRALAALLGAALFAAGPGASSGALLVAVVATAAVGLAVHQCVVAPAAGRAHGQGRSLEAAFGAPLRPLPPLATSLRVRR